MKDKPSPSTTSLLALDALNVFLADVRDGLGPYLAIYLATRDWEPGKIGIAMSAMGVATVAAQTPAGAFIDSTRHKRGALMVAAMAVAVAAVAMVRSPILPTILVSQVAMGVAGAVFPPAVAAITLGLVGHARFVRRTGRNEAFNHAGNVAAALLAGVIGHYIAYEGIFYLLAGMCLASMLTTLVIRDREIDHELARGADCEAAGAPQVVGIAELFRDRRVVLFSVSVVLFHFANAAMLPLVGQKMTAGKAEMAAGYMSACIVAAQLVMVPVAVMASRFAESLGRKPTFLIGFAVLPLRGLLYTWTSDPYALVAIQLLDGIGAGIFGVVGVLVIADLTKGTGRFNLMQGALATATGIGASLSTLMTGYVVEAAGFNVGFTVLAAIAGVALAFYGLFVPETKPATNEPATFALAERRGAMLI